MGERSLTTRKHGYHERVTEEKEEGGEEGAHFPSTSSRGPNLVVQKQETGIEETGTRAIRDREGLTMEEIMRAE